MPKVSEEHRTARRDEILDAALRTFSAKGLERASMADIIAESGLSAGAIYGHFAGKRELIAAVAQRTLGARRAELEAAQAGGAPLSPAEVLGLLLRGMRASFDTGLLVQLWAAAATDTEVGEAVRGPVASIRATFTEAMRPWFEAHADAHGASPAEALARCIPLAMALGQGFMIQRQLFDDFDEERYLAMVAEVLPH
ncbi:TetR/AcrR family transcriptional regulator [Agromyces mediolanus]|uniref:TetR/AcrR family transcriptional regulator n=1 Tax=Agromyces mediolanus TaxID=41986 RepID=UPI003832798D